MTEVHDEAGNKASAYYASFLMGGSNRAVDQTVVSFILVGDWRITMQQLQILLSEVKQVAQKV